MAFQFSASDQWISEILSQSVEFSIPDHAKISYRSSLCFDFLLPLYDHDALSDKYKFMGLVRRVYAGHPLLSRKQIMNWSECRKASQFARSARAVIGIPYSLRTRDVFIRTNNLLGKDFVPPQASRVSPGLVHLFKASRQISSQISKPESSIVGMAMAAYFIVLTIHPFSDGNGRASRFYFASRVSCVFGASSILLLALCFLHRNHGTAFQLAAKLARLGDFSPLLSEYQGCILSAHEEFNDDLLELSELLWLSVGNASKNTEDDMSAELGLNVLLRIRSKVISRVLK